MLPPASRGAPRQLVVIFHGYGADGADLIGLARAWQHLLPDAVFVAPNAPDPCDINPAGYQWWPVDLDRLVELSTAGVRAARPVVERFLADLWRQTGLGPAETVLCGFSQGAMVALHVGLVQTPPVAGIIAFSGALLPPEDFAPPGPPILLAHGDADDVVDHHLSLAAEEQLRAAGYDVTLHLSPGFAHTISPDALEAATAFLTRVLPLRA
jgi:phospholipase/carboxylesterase